MFRLIETIKLKDGVLQNIQLHNKRINYSRLKLYGWSKDILLGKKDLGIDEYCKGVFKCRVLYNKSIESIEILPYQMKKINSLKMVFSDFISYDYKFENRISFGSDFLGSDFFQSQQGIIMLNLPLQQLLLPMQELLSLKNI